MQTVQTTDHVFDVVQNQKRPLVWTGVLTRVKLRMVQMIITIGEERLSEIII